MDKHTLLQKILALQKEIAVLDSNPLSNEYVNWSAELEYLIGLTNPSKANGLHVALHYASIGLSDESRNPLIFQIKSTIQQTVIKLRTEAGKETDGKIQGEYPAGDQFGFYTDLKKLISGAKEEILFVDPYLDYELLEMCFDRVKDIHLRVLTSTPDSKVIKSLEMLKNKNGLNLEFRTSNELHDRYVTLDEDTWTTGQSIKDAAAKKPTYLMRLSMEAIKNENEKIWGRAKVIM